MGIEQFMENINWFLEIIKYDLNVVFTYWKNEKDFLEERSKWVKLNKT